MEQRGDDPRLYLTPKGIEFRDRLLSLLDPELAPAPAHVASADSSPYLAPTPK
jgi:hypothetical protein